MKATTKKAPAPAVREVRAVVVCRPPIANDARRLSAAGLDAAALPELDIRPPPDAGAGERDAGLLRDISVGRDAALRLPVYGHHGADAEQLCEREVAPLLGRLLQGESSAVIAYGATGSGKSYTMGTEKYGDGQVPAPHSVGSFCARRVFELAGEPGVRDLEVSFAAIEIYREGKERERLFDLQTLERKRIESFESQASWLRVTGPEELQRKLLDASFLRNTDRTDGNTRSSRSHAIFVTQVQFKRQQEGGGGLQRVKARLMLVDLAGSERAALAAPGSAVQKQGSGINVGLLYLGMVIKELSERGSTLGYRNSTLTEILKPALGGGANELTSSCNTLMVGCISPLALQAVNTRSTLEFLQAAGTVKNLVRADVQMLRQQELEAQVEALQEALRGMELRFKQQELAMQQERQGSLSPAAAAGPAEAAAATAAAFAAGQQASPGRSSGGEEEEEEGETEEKEARLAALEREVAILRRDLVEQRDRADAYEAQLRQQAAAGAAAPAGGTAGALAFTPAAANAAGGTPGGAGSLPPTVPAAAAGRSPAIFLAAASPLLAASRGVADWVADTAAAEAATPAGERLPLLRLLPGAEEICCLRESHMLPDELAALKDKVDKLLGAAADGDDRQQALAFAEACLYSLGAYNKCLGDAITEAEDAAEDAAAERRQADAEFRQLFEEKVLYMRRTSAAEGGLAQYETQVEELEAKLAVTQETLQQLQQSQGTPGRWGTLSRLLTGASPTAPARSPGTNDSRRTSRSGSPVASPRASLAAQQQLFGSSPSRLGQGQGPRSVGEPSGPDEPGERRATIACARDIAGQHEAATARVFAESKQRRSLAGLPPPAGKARTPGELKAARHAGQQQQQQQEEGGEEALIKAVRPAAPGSSAAGALQSHPSAGAQRPSAAAQAASAAQAAPAEQQQAQQDGSMEQQGQQQAQQDVSMEQQPAAAEAVAGKMQQAEGKEREEEQQQAEEDAEVVTPLGSPEVSCMLEETTSGAEMEECSQQQPQQLEAVLEAPAEEAAVGSLSDWQQQMNGTGSAAQGRHEQQQHGSPGVGPQLPAAPSPDEEMDQRQQAAGPPAAAEEPQPPPASEPAQQQGPAPQPQEQLEEAVPQQQDAVPQQQQEQEQQAQPQQQQPCLPGPSVTVWVPQERPGGRGRGRGKQAAASWLELEYSSASGLFTDPGSEEIVDVARLLAHLPAGEPWQRHVFLKGGSISLERWHARRMLLPGRCHMCCGRAAERECRHPEPAFGELQLCSECHESLEPDTWRAGETWISDDPSDRAYRWCCLCGGAGVGSTDTLVVCGTCREAPCSELPCGFCTGCLWRFTGDDLAEVKRDGWQCLHCRQQPKLHLAYAEESAEAKPSGSGASSGGSSGRRGRSGSVQPGAAAGGEQQEGLRRSSRQRQPRTAAKGRPGAAAGAVTPGWELEIDLSSPESSSSSGGSSDASQQQRGRGRGRGQARAKQQAAAAGMQPASGRLASRRGKAPAAVAPAPGGGAGGRQAQQAGQGSQALPARKRLLPQGDIASPLGEDGQLLHLRQRVRHLQQHPPGQGRAQSQQAAGGTQLSQQDRDKAQAERLKAMLAL